MVKRVVLLLSVLLLALSCSSKSKTYRIGVDPSWYPLNFMGKEPNVFAFADELLRAIAHEEGVFFERVTVSWDNLIYGLKKGSYEGILGTMTPRTSLEKSYFFSEPFLYTGPVLVVANQTKVSSLSQMKGREIAVDSYHNEAILVEQLPGVTVRYYAVIPDALDKIIAGQIDGALVNYLPATSYIRDLYYGKIKIATPPLDDSALRLVTLQGQDQELIKIFNRGFEKIRDQGIYDKLLKKWGLY